MKSKWHILTVVGLPLCAAFLYAASYFMVLLLCGYIQVNGAIRPLYPVKGLRTFFAPVSYVHHRLLWKWEEATEARRFRGTVRTIVSQQDLAAGHVLEMRDLALMRVPETSVLGIAFVFPSEAPHLKGRIVVRPVTRLTPLK